MNFQCLCFCNVWNEVFDKECHVTYYHNKWGGLMVRVFASIPKVKGSNFINGVVCGQQWYVDQIFSYLIPRRGA
jgi:hypothetical protein